MIPIMARPLLEEALSTWDPKRSPSLLAELYVEWMSGIAAFEEEVNAQHTEEGEGDGERDGEEGGGVATSTAYQCLGLILEQVSE
jgi:hypothetical protein